MCFDEKTSWATFIIGTLFNLYGIIYYKDSRYTAVALMWEWILLMQIFDAIAWRNPQCGTQENKFASRGAYIANMTQPIVIYLVMILLKNEVETKNKILASVFILAYICSILNSSQDIQTVNCLQRTDKCSNLQYRWWDKQNLTLGLYFLCVLGLPILLFRPVKFAVFTSVFIMSIFIVSLFLYKCGVASVWCWMAAFAPILNLLVWDKLV